MNKICCLPYPFYHLSFSIFQYLTVCIIFNLLHTLHKKKLPLISCCGNQGELMLYLCFFKLSMDTNRKLTDMTGKKPRTPGYKYSFRLNEEQNIRFYELLCKSGSEHNRSRFIVKRLFAEEFVVVKRDPSKVQFIARLNDFYFQFQRIGNNYNQVVKAVNSHFSNIAIPHQIALLEQRTRELKALSIEILNLAKRAAEWLRI